jgi:hypothetical protein
VVEQKEKINEGIYNEIIIFEVSLMIIIILFRFFYLIINPRRIKKY